MTPNINSSPFRILLMAPEICSKFHSGSLKRELTGDCLLYEHGRAFWRNSHHVKWCVKKMSLQLC